MVALVFATMASTPGSAQTEIPPTLRARYDSSYFAWDRGDYLQALRHADAILGAPGGEALLERIALLTGELYRVHELTTDGRAAQWSPTGDLASFESGADSEVHIHLVTTSAPGPREVTSFPGRDAVFSPDGAHLAYFRGTETAEIEAARAEQRRAADAGDGAAARTARQRIAQLEAAAAEIVIRATGDGSETVHDAPGIERHGLAFASDGTAILIGREADQADRLDLYLLEESGTSRITEGPGVKGDRLFPVGRGRLVYTIGNDRIAIQDVATSEVEVFEGRSPAVSRDGSTLAYVGVADAIDAERRRGDAVAGADALASGDLSALIVRSLEVSGETRVVKQTTLPLANPALSPSGRRVAYNSVLRDDWEVFVVDSEGSEERRVTYEVQHDLFPQFLSETRLLALVGESRHRRSYLYDLDTADPGAFASDPMPGDDQRGRTQLFHNNTLRTVAPQYGWVPSGDGSRILVVADRDGDTLSPERGVYLVDLDERVGHDEVRARIATQLTAETDLRERGRAMFASLDDQIRPVVADVEVGRVYDHAHALYRFGSKFITQPGNALAIEYLASSLRAMGYEPELQWFEPRPGVPSANVVATLRGTTNPERINIISSHFDSVERGPGSDDNTSGTTALLEAARVLATRPQLETIKFVFFTGEEAGLLGSREFIRRTVENGDQVVAALNNDMIGWTRSHRLDNTIRYSNATIRDIQHNAAILFTDLITYDARYVLSTDAQVFWDNFGDIVGGIGSYPILGNPHYHQSHDQLEVINHSLVAEVAKTAVASIMLLANGVELGEEG